VGHVIGELNPQGILGLDRAGAGKRGAAGTDDIGELVVDALNVGTGKEVSDRGHAGGRSGIEKCGACRGVVVCVVFLVENAADAEEVAEDADAAFGGRGITGDGRDLVVASADGAKDVELDGGLESGGFLIGLGHIEDKAGVGGGCGRRMRGHERPPITGGCS